ncbi:MAG: metal ABC transporter permease, partial [Clostridia bacterium]|nr:metal ABC transporter permease [Clostridia bacterium]
MFDNISQIISYGFISRALIVGLLITVCSSFLGVTLVLKRYSMIGDGLSHISFGAVAVASVMGLSPMKIAIPVVIAVSIFLLRINGKKIKGDSAIAILSTAALAFGVMVISCAGSSADLNNYLIGSIYAIDKEDMILSIV